jgi:hypothetical protein
MRNRSCHATRALGLVALVGGLFSPATLLGQQKPDPLAGKASDIKAMLRAGEISDETTFDDFFNKYLFKQFVSPTRPYSLDTLSKLRMDLKVQYCTVAKTDSEARTRLNKMTLQFMDKLSNGKYGQYDAAIKFNALLVIGDLNEREGDAKNDAKNPAKPYSESLPVLIRTVSGDSKDYSKMAALIGLGRFAAAGAIPPSKAGDLTSSLLKMVNQKSPSADRSQEANDWFRRSAGQVLASLGNPGPGNSVAKAFESVVADSDAGPMTRCEFAQYLGQLKYPPSAKVDLSALANSLGHMAADICKQELESAKLANRPPSRRVVVCSLYNAGFGLKGVLAAAENSSHKEFVDNLYKRVASLHKWIDDPKFEEDTLAVELGGKINELETALIAQPTAKLVSDQKEKATQPADQKVGARAAVDAGAKP